MEEIWKPVVGYEFTLEVSNLGRVRRCEYLVDDVWLICKIVPARLLTLYKNTSSGYYEVNFDKKTFAVSKLVATAFIPNPKQYKFVKHLDENLYNNEVENLKWVEKRPHRKVKTDTDTYSLSELNTKAKVLSVDMYLENH